MAPDFEGITPFTCDNLSLLKSPPLPGGWEVFYHPRNGDVYYWNRDERIITENDIYDTSVLTGVLQAKGKVMRELQRRGLYGLFCTDQGKLKGPWDLIIEDRRPLSLVGWRLEDLYEFVADEEKYIKHASKRVFWLRVAEFPCHHFNLLRRAEQQMTHIRRRHPRLTTALLNRPDNMELYKEYRAYRHEALAMTPSKYCDYVPAVVWRLACLLSEAYEMTDARDISLKGRAREALST